MNPGDTYDPMFGIPQMGFGYGNGIGNNNMNEGRTPGTTGTDNSAGTTGTEEKDPFLSLLEQLAENEHSRGGPSELDFFLSGGNG